MINVMSRSKIEEKPEKKRKVKVNAVTAKLLNVAVPVGDVQIDHSIEVRSVYQLYDMLKRGVIYIDPDLQRGYVWDDVKASLFLDSLYRGYPVHMIILARVGKDKYTVIDGVQRLVTIRRFFDNELKIIRVSTIHPDIRGRTFNNLKHEVREKFMSVISMPVCFINIGDMNEKAIAVITDMLRRVNISEQKMTTMQVIFCTFKLPSIQMVKKVAQYEKYQSMMKFTETEIKMMYDKVLIFNLAVSIYHETPILTHGYSMNRNMDKITKFFVERDGKKIETLEKWLRDLIDLAVDLGLERKYFTSTFYGLSRAARENVSKLIFLAVMYGLYMLSKEHDRDEIVKARDRIINAIVDYFKKLDRAIFRSASSGVDGDIKKIINGLVEKLVNSLKS